MAQVRGATATLVAHDVLINIYTNENKISKVLIVNNNLVTAIRL